MKRVLSWIVAFLCCYVFRIAAYLVFSLAFLIAEKIYYFSEVLFWVIVVVEGTAIIGFAFIGVFGGSSIAVKASQKVWKSKKGTRYLIAGLYYIIGYSLILLCIIIGVATANVVIICADIATVIFGILLIVAGKAAVAEDGAPPTKTEILEARLQKLKEKENN